MNHPPATQPRRTPRERTMLGILLGFAAIVAPGCSLPYLGISGPVVWGRVSLQGKPLEDGFVMLAPEEATHGNEGMVPVDSQGNYQIDSDYRGRPLNVGWYRITLLPNRLAMAPPTDGATTEQSFFDPNKPVSPIPRIYYDPSTTPLRIWVRPQPQRIDIALQSPQNNQGRQAVQTIQGPKTPESREVPESREAPENHETPESLEKFRSYRR